MGTQQRGSSSNSIRHSQYLKRGGVAHPPKDTKSCSRIRKRFLWGEHNAVTAKIVASANASAKNIHRCQRRCACQHYPSSISPTIITTTAKNNNLPTPPSKKKGKTYGAQSSRVLNLPGWLVGGLLLDKGGGGMLQQSTEI